MDTGTQTHFRGLSVVSRKVAWLGGYDGVVLRTVDGGRTWINASPAGASALQFRDIQAFSATAAVAMAAGTGTDSRLYVTANGGRSWRLAYTNTNPQAFFDCMAFFNPRHGLVLSDPVNGKFRILATRDGGRDWSVLPTAGMPPALPGEAGFAASGECLTTFGHDAWFGSGASTAARVFSSRDGGLTWHVATTPIVTGATAGVFALAFRTPLAGVAVGGDFANPTAATHVGGPVLPGQPVVLPAVGPGGLPVRRHLGPAHPRHRHRGRPDRFRRLLRRRPDLAHLRHRPVRHRQLRTRRLLLGLRRPGPGRHPATVTTWSWPAAARWLR